MGDFIVNCLDLMGEDPQFGLLQYIIIPDGLEGDGGGELEMGGAASTRNEQSAQR